MFDEHDQKIQQLQQQIDTLNGTILQLQTQITNMANGPLVSQRNDNRVYAIPFLPYAEIEPNHDTDKYFKNLLKWICENYKNARNCTWIGAVYPNSLGWVILTIYDTNDVKNDLPHYCGGTYQTCINKIYTFSTHEYVFSSKLFE